MKLRSKFWAISAFLALLVGFSQLMAQTAGPAEPGRKGARAAIEKEQRGVGESHRRHLGGGERGWQALVRALELNEGQVESFRQLRLAQHEAMQPMRESLKEERRRLRELLNQENPDPFEIGTSVLAAHEHRLQMRALHEQSREAFRNMLTPSQEQKLDEMLQSPRARRLLGPQGGIQEGEREPRRIRRFESPPMQ
jgi:Spy/CpxP family protein refolding chaperone